jgi:rubrerythrin
MNRTEKKYDLLDVLSGVSGLGKGEAKKIFEEVKENQKRLEGCEAPHEFSLEDPAKPLRSKWVCRKCGGKVQHGDHHWYALGLAHGKRAGTVG